MADLRDLHRGEELTIFGKGPSLDHFDTSSFSGIGICVNQSIRVVPQASYYVGCGKGVLRELTGIWRPRHRFLLETKCAEWAWSSGVSPEQCYPFVARKGLFSQWSVDRFARGELYSLTSNAQPAVCLALLLGASFIRLVGCDGGRHWARSVGCGTTRHTYDVIKHHTTKLLEWSKVPFEFWTSQASVA